MNQLELGEQLRDEGIERVSENNEDWLLLMRTRAITHSRIRGSVSSVEVRQWCELLDYWPTHQNAFGAVFACKGWKHIGYRRAEHAKGHAREIKVWRWEE